MSMDAIPENVNIEHIKSEINNMDYILGVASFDIYGL